MDKMMLLERLQHLFIGLVFGAVIAGAMPCGEASEPHRPPVQQSATNECGTVVTLDDDSPGHVVSIGELNAADHEIDEGWWHVGTYFDIMVNPKSMTHSYFLLNRGKEVRVVIRPAARPQLKQVAR